MKKFCFAICLIVAGFTAKLQAKDKQLVNVYGVDYTKVWIRDEAELSKLRTKVSSFLNRAETAKEYVATFEDINLLLLTESDKYDFKKMLHKPVKVDVEPICELIRHRDTVNLRERPERPIDIAAQIRSYRLNETDGVGMVFVATNLDKRMGVGTYVVVCFDIATRDILFRYEITTEAGGFGLRNYWANTVEDIIENNALRSELRRLLK